ncbi:MAG: hypothetical protein ACI3YB_02625 [Prevotella sp.]
MRFLRPCDGLQIVFGNSLRGMPDVCAPMMIAFFTYFVISLPVVYVCVSAIS